MRHGKKFNHLGRKTAHRKAMLSNMCTSLILHKRISTTLAKAKELRKYAEPLVTRSKEDTTHNRRMVFSYLQNKEAIKVLFGEVAEKVGSRPGGYTRIIKTGYRLGDNAEMCIIELVDFNELMLKDAQPAKKTTRRSRRGSGKPKEGVQDTVAEASERQEPKDEEVSETKKDEIQPEENAVEPATDTAVQGDGPKAEEAEVEPVTEAEEPAAEDEAETVETPKAEEEPSAGDETETENSPKAEDKTSEDGKKEGDDKKA